MEVDVSSDKLVDDNAIDRTHDGCAHRPSSAMGLAPTIEDFEILKPISRGAFGKVFLCHRKNNPEKKLAVKVMKKSDLVQKNMVDQMIAERNALAITKSPFCVGLLYCLQTTNNVFLVMEYMIGGDLKSLLGVYGFFPEEQAVFYLAECVLALQYLHSRGIVHRDIKPDNMLISHTGHLKLTDFGLSTTGVRDRELHVADLVGRTPWPAGSRAMRERLIRTPGQILSLTSHLSFSNVTENDSYSKRAGESFAGSYATAKDSILANVSRNGQGSDPCISIPASNLSGSFSSRPISMSFTTTGLLNVTSTPSDMPKNSNSTPSQQFKRSPLITPMASNRGRLVRKNSFTEALARHTKEEELSRKVLDRNHGMSPVASPETKLNSSSLGLDTYKLQSLPNSSLDLGQNKTIEFAPAEQFVSPGKESVLRDEVFEEDKENICLPSSPLRNILSSPLNGSGTSLPGPSDQDFNLPSSPPCPDFNHGSIDLFQTSPSSRDLCQPSSPPTLFNDDSRGSISSSPKLISTSSKPLCDNLDISPVGSNMSTVTSRMTNPAFSGVLDNLGWHSPPRTRESKITPVLPAEAVTSSSARDNENIRSLRDRDSTLSPEQLRFDKSHVSWDSDIHLEKEDDDSRLEVSQTESGVSDKSQNMELSQENEDSFTEENLDLSNPSTHSHSSLPSPPLTSPGSVERKEHSQIAKPFTNNCDLRRRSPSLNLQFQSLNDSQFKVPAFSSRKRKCSGSAPKQMQVDTGITGDLTDMLLSKRSKVDKPPMTVYPSEVNNMEDMITDSTTKSSSSSSEEEQGPGYGNSTPVQFSTPLSAVPNHLKLLKKAVKFVSPAGLTPVQHPGLPKPLAVEKLPCPLILADLDSSRPCTPPHFVSPNPTLKTPSHSIQQTPLRTPKSINRPGRTSVATRILGTPDYLAPELLLGQGDTKAVDWWALGVCLYEFMTGIPPFNDSTADLVFENILNLNIEWPEGEEALSQEAVDTILALLTFGPVERADGDFLMGCKLTQEVDWANILDQQPPFVPNPDSATDTTYFNARNSLQGLNVSSVDL